LKQPKWVPPLIIILMVAAGVVIARVPVQLGLDLVGGVRGVFRAQSLTPGKVVTPDEMNTAIQVIDRRVNALGVSETQVQQKGTDQIIVEIPLTGKVKESHITAAEAENRLQSLVQAAVLNFIEMPSDIRVEPGPRNDKGQETFTYFGPDNKPIPESQALARAKIVLNGSDLQPNSKGEFSSDPSKGYEVALQFNDKGARIFGDYTTTHVHKYFGITLDNRLLTYPIINEPIPDGRAVISGGFNSLEEAQTLAVLLNAGALPVKLVPIQTTVIEATLGQNSVRTSLWAGIAGLILVVFFMIAYYRLPGILASVALLIYAELLFAVFKAIPVTLTLPGIAGVILSVGMAVDANILIFERMKEEIRDGRTLRSAIDAGFKRALTAIVDSNACTLIACGVLGFYGTGPVKGFAITLAIGVIISLFTAVTVTRTLLHLLDNATGLQRPEFFGTNIQWMGKWAYLRNGAPRDIIGNRRFYYLLSLAVIVPGLIFISMGYLHKGVDFTGGNEWVIQTRQPITEPVISKAMAAAKIPRTHYDLEIGRSLDSPENLATIHTKPGVFPKSLTALKAMQSQILDTLHGLGVRDASTASDDHIDPIIGKELEFNALAAVLIASTLIVLYLTFRFHVGGNFKAGAKYGFCAIFAMLHDVLVVIGVFAILGYALQVEIDMNFVTAILTIIGFSVHDTIVIFDRVRENLYRRGKDETFEETYNKSIIQTAARSINTSFTVLLVLLALVFFGAPVIKWFIVALLVGITSGTYSSIFNASPLVVDWEHIKRRRERSLSAAVTRASSGATAGGKSASAVRPGGFGAPAQTSRTNGANGGAARPQSTGAGVRPVAKPVEVPPGEEPTATASPAAIPKTARPRGIKDSPSARIMSKSKRRH